VSEFIILTLFPEMFRGPFQESIIGRAQKKGKLRIQVVNLRDYTQDWHQKVDDRLFGGGPGMLIGPQPLFSAVKALKARKKTRVIYLTPQGKQFDGHVAKRLAQERRIMLVCGHYEGIDERARQELMDEELSIGDYVTTGGEIPAMVVVDAIARFIPGVLGDQESAQHESFENGLLEGPQYTRPAVFKGMKVPEILMSGHHDKIKEWRHKQDIKRTRERRPDLLRKNKKKRGQSL
jgi:tRNA (guanine37-N1)-methyltransferase